MTTGTLTFYFKQNWVTYEGNCYMFVNRTQRTWQQARFRCMQLNSDLASIHSQDEMDFIMANINEKSKINTMLKNLGSFDQCKVIKKSNGCMTFANIWRLYFCYQTCAY